MFEKRVANSPKTILTAFFYLCQDDFARGFMYCDSPHYYTWNSMRKMWNRHKQGTPVPDHLGVRSSDTTGSVYTVHPLNFECFCMRLLLHVVRGPTSFANLSTVDGQQCETFREACSKRGLLEDDAHWDKPLEEAAASHSAVMLRSFSAVMIVLCSLGDGRQLWGKYKENFVEDVLLRYVNTLQIKMFSVIPL
jgi:hypothetical protein